MAKKDKSGSREIQDQIKDSESAMTFICPRCGTVSLESDRCRTTGECVYC